MSDNSPQAPSPEHLGELLPQYGIESFIAQGGMGAVYKGRQLSLDRDVAIKVLLYECGEDAEFRESFTTEAKAMARLNHPNLLGVFDYGDIDGMPYIVMEYVDGGSLHEAAWNKVLEPSQAVAIVKGICDGLAHAHGHDIVHRDIKPSNILLTPKAEPKVADFGLAHATDSDKPGLVMGTPGYTAPEVFQNPDQAGKLADIYAVGVILHQLLTGIDPAGCLEPPTQVTGNPHLDVIWRKATHITPALRYTSVAAMASDLGNWAAAMQKAPVATGRAPIRPLVPRRPVKTRTGGGGGGILSKLLLIGILAVVGFFTYQRLRENKERVVENQAGTPDPTSIPGAQPESAPPDQVEPSSTPDPDPGEVGMREESVVPPVVDSEDEPEPETSQDLKPGDPELRQRAIGLIADARKKRDKGLADSASGLIFQLGNSARGFTKDQVAFIERLKGGIIDNRVPRTDNIRGLPDEIARDFEQARTKEGAVDKAYRTELTRIRDAYILRLEKAAAETPDAELKQRLLAQAERAKDLNSWVGLLAPESASISTKSPGAYGSGGIAGHWNFVIRKTGNISRWIARPDGKLVDLTAKIDGTWEILEGDTLEVRWQERNPWIFTRADEGWTGRTGNGAEASLTPGDW